MSAIESYERRLNKHGARVDSRSFPPLPAKPLADAIGRLINEEQTDLLPLEAACESFGTNAKAYQDWRFGRRVSVTFDVADRVLCRTGLLWFEVWGDDPTAELAFTGEVRDA